MPMTEARKGAVALEFMKAAWRNTAGSMKEGEEFQEGLDEIMKLGMVGVTREEVEELLRELCSLE